MLIFGKAFKFPFSFTCVSYTTSAGSLSLALRLLAVFSRGHHVFLRLRFERYCWKLGE